MIERKSTPISRRGFMQAFNALLSAVGAGILLGPVVAYFWPAKLEEVPSEPVGVGPADSIPVGEAKTVRFGRYPALVINTASGIRSYSAVCTHFACLVKWNAASGMVECPCHAGFFNADDGSVISGPPPEALHPIPNLVRDDTLYIGGEA